MKIALSGRMKAGKSILARTLRDEYGYHLLDYSAYIKEMLARGLTAAGQPTHADDIAARKDELRDLLIHFARALGIDKGAGVWGLVGRYHTEENVVFDSVRSAMQMDILALLGFTQAVVTVPDALQEKRAKADGMAVAEVKRLRDDATEIPFPVFPGALILDGARPVSQLALEVVTHGVIVPAAADAAGDGREAAES